MILHGIEYQRPTSLNMRIMADHVTYSFLAFMKSIFHFCFGCYCGGYSQNGRSNLSSSIGLWQLLEFTRENAASIMCAWKSCEKSIIYQRARFMGPTWGPSGTDRTQVGPMLAPWTLLSGMHLFWYCIMYMSWPMSVYVEFTCLYCCKIYFAIVLFILIILKLYQRNGFTWRPAVKLLTFC